jgi:aspartate carbamoyltransferase catalytic subunit
VSGPVATEGPAVGVAAPSKPARSGRRHLLDFTDWHVDELMALLDTAEVMSQVLTRTIKKVPALQGFTVASLFFEDSTRTRLSFERAARAQSADVLTFSAGGSSLKKGESMRDTLRTIDQLQVDLYVVRHGAAGAPHQLARWTDSAVVNAGDGRHAHPTQALLDAYTFRAARREATGEALPGADAFTGQRLAIVGDIGHSRVARSNIELFTALGAEVVLCGPPTLVPPELRSRRGVTVTNRLPEAVEGAAAVMALRMQKERMATGLLPSVTEYVARYQVTERMMRLAAPGAVVMHPGPMNRDVEIESTVADGPRSVIERQVGNGVPVRMAVLYTLLVGRR